MTLYIDTINFDSVTFTLKNGSSAKKTYQVDPHKAYETLAKLEEFLKESKINLPVNGKILKIVANKGPGSYTGTRVGVTHALALGFALGIPVKFLSKDKFEKQF